MADVATIGGAGLVAGVVALAPKAFALAQTWIAKRSEVEIEANAAGTSVAYRIDGTLVATNTSNIPTGAGRETGIAVHVLKSAGTNNRPLYADFMGHYIERSANV